MVWVASSLSLLAMTKEPRIRVVMHYLLAITIAALITLFAPPAMAAESSMTIAVFTKNSTNPAYAAFRLAADKVGQATGAKIEHFVPKQPDNVDEQKALVEQVLKQHPDVVVFIPVDDVAMAASVRKLNDADIPVVLASNPLPGQFVTYVGADDFDIGYREAHYLFDKLGGKGQIVILEGTASAPTNRERLRGYKKALAEAPGIKVLASVSGNYQQADGKRAMAQMLKDFPEIDALLSANDSMAIGALDAMKEAGRSMTVVGINGILPAVKEIEAGHILATVDFNMFKIGCTATIAAVRYLHHEPMPDKVMLPADIIDKNNYKAWLVPVEQRTCPDWAALVQ
jgi:ribose transport system substrate-binding protein